LPRRTTYDLIKSSVGQSGRGEDALSLARLARTDSMGFGTIVYWGGVEITD
jgi:hypothetical protein